MVHTGKTLYANVSGGELWINILHKSPKHGLASKSWADYLPLTKKVRKRSRTDLHLDSRILLPESELLSSTFTFSLLSNWKPYVIIAHNLTVTMFSQDDDFTFKRSFPKLMLCSIIQIVAMGFSTGDPIWKPSSSLVLSMQNANSHWQNGSKWYVIGYCEIDKGAHPIMICLGLGHDNGEFCRRNFPNQRNAQRVKLCMSREALKSWFYDFQAAWDEYRFLCGVRDMNHGLIWWFMDITAYQMYPIHYPCYKIPFREWCRSTF